MEPIISPWLIYLLGIVDNVSFALGLFGFLSGIGLFFYISLNCFKGECKSDEEKLTYAKAKLKCSCWIFPIFLFLVLVVPSKKTIMGMIVAQQITPSNIESAVKTGKDFKNEIKKDVIDIIQSVTKEKKEDKKMKGVQMIPKDLMELDKFKLMVELLNPNADNDREKRLLDEKDDIWKEKLMIIERRDHGI